MRITIINQFYVPDVAPTGQLCGMLAEHWADPAGHDHDVTVVASRGGYSEDARKATDRDSTKSTVRVHRVWTPRLGKANLIKRLTDYAFFYLGTFLKLLFMPRQDVIISLTTPPLIAWAGVLHKLIHRKTKLILWNMDCYPEAPERIGMIKTDGAMSRLVQFFNRGLFKRLDHLISLDQAMQDLLLDRYRPKKHELPATVIPNFEAASFYPLEAQHDEWEGVDRLGLAGKFVVLYMGNMGVGHDFDTALDAAELLLDDEQIHFIFNGGGGRKEEVAKEAVRRNLRNVTVQSYIPKAELPSLMAAGSAALITLRDTMLGVMSPSKLHGNLAMRLPVLYVGPAGSNVDFAIQQHSCGRTIPVGDAKALASTIRELAGDPAKHEQMRIAARRAFDEAYNDRAVMPQFDRVIDQLTASVTE